MEADWSVEIGAGLPVIDANWPGFIDLRRDLHSLDSISEAVAEPVLRQALVALNDPGSLVFTSKCDVWALTKDEIDPDEFGCAPHEPCSTGLASWIDIIARDAVLFASFETHEAWVRRAAEQLHAEAAACGQVDLVLRAAEAGSRDGFGITLYTAGCGADTQAAHAAWERAVYAAVAATMRESRASSSIG